MPKILSRVRPALLVVSLALVVGGVAGGWALRTLLGAPPAVLDAPPYTLVTASEGTVEQSIRLSASARWSPTAVLPNAASGTVTTVKLQNGTTVGAGATLYTVGLRPVVVAAGAIPAFRDLREGDSGADVAQLQRLLAQLGFPSGQADGKFDATVTGAVDRWQRSLGVAADGSVRNGDLIYVPALPARLALDTHVAVGIRLAGGEPAVQVLPSTPTFKIDLPENQARMLSAGMAVEIQAGGGRWSAKIGDVTTDDKGARVAQLASATNEPICAQQCASVKIDGETQYPSRIWLVAPTSGVVVPTVALVTDASGRTGVILAGGEFHPVAIVANASGTAVVTGIEAGQAVRAPGKPSAGRP